jgi:hypothetical protein
MKTETGDRSGRWLRGGFHKAIADTIHGQNDFRDTPRPRLRTRIARISNSVGVNRIGSPRHMTQWSSMSTRKSPQW